MYALYRIDLIAGSWSIIGVTTEKTVAESQVNSRKENEFIGYYSVPILV